MAEDLVARALTSLRNRDFVAARNCIAAFAAENPLEFQHYLIKGLSEIALKDWAAAAATFGEATRFFPHQPQLWFNLGVAQENGGLIEDAAESFEHSLDLKPEQGDACGNLSNVYRRMGLFEEAEKMAHRAYEFGAPKPQALNCLGLALARQGKNAAAGKIFHQVLELDPGNPHAMANMANLSVDRLDFDPAWLLFAAARAKDNDPAIRHDEALARLLAGDYASGWPLHEARLEKPTALRVRPSGPLWRGEEISGRKLLLVAEQGFGDVIHFCRYGATLAQRGADIAWMVPKALERLLSANLPGRVLYEGDPVPDADFWLPLMSLPLVTQKFSPTDAPPAPYLHAPDGPKLPGVKKDRRAIGIVWAGSPTHERALERSIPLHMFAPLWTQIPGSFYAPFTGPALDEITGQTPVMRLDKLITDFADTAALLMQLDSLVTVDTAVAHLAGALGVKTYLLLSYCPDWRWGLSSTMTALYPSVTLLRQQKPGEWESVIGEVVERLRV
jgi:Flp pilus assembly protein TadD